MGAKDNITNIYTDTTFEIEEIVKLLAKALELNFGALFEFPRKTIFMG